MTLADRKKKLGGQAGLEVKEGTVTCEGPHHDRSACGAYIVNSTVEFKGLCPQYEYDTSPATMIDGFEYWEPEQKALL